MNKGILGTTVVTGLV